MVQQLIIEDDPIMQELRDSDYGKGIFPREEPTWNGKIVYIMAELLRRIDELERRLNDAPS